MAEGELAEALEGALEASGDFVEEPPEEVGACDSVGGCVHGGDIDKAVKQFKDRTRFTKETKEDQDFLWKKGQFFWTCRIERAVKSEWSGIKGYDLPEWAFGRYHSLFKAANDDATYFADEAEELLERIDASESQSGPADWHEPLRKLVKPHDHPSATDLWAKLQKAKPPCDQFPPISDRLVNLQTLAEMYADEKDICGGAAKRVQRMTKTLSSAPRIGFRGISDEPGLGDIVKYKNKTSQFAEIKRLIDHCKYAEARVLSGVWLDHGESSEHSLLLIGYDDKKFVFWDPDTGSAGEHSHAFGYLYYSTGNFTTARSTSDPDREVDANGDHRSHGWHRYQVVFFR